MRRSQLYTAIGFISPWLMGFIGLVLYPFLASFYWSFCRYDLLSRPEFIGWGNYQRLASEILQDGRFGQAIWNTAYYAVISVPLSIALGILLAVALSWKVRGQAVYRTLLFLPSVVPVVATSVLWMWLLDPNDGIVNRVLEWCGIPPQKWFHGVDEFFVDSFYGNPQLGSKDALVVMSLWGVGNFMIIYLAALGDVPRSLYEAAQLDGANAVRRFWNITLPLLSPIIFFNLVMGLIQSVQAFTQIYLVSHGQGDPDHSTLVLSLHLFLAAFQDLEMGYASAMSWVLFMVIAGVTWALFRTSGRWVHYGGGTR